jgi:hypothetical protein
MPTTIAATSIHTAVENERKARHHTGCRCGLWERHWCTPEEKYWWNTIDRLLTEIRRASF